MFSQGLIHTFKRYNTLRSHHVTVLPIVILMPHSACNCRCVMCDIWKGNANKKQLTLEDVQALLVSLKKLDSRRVLMSGGEALLNPHFFEFCRILKQNGIKVSLLSTGLTLERHAGSIIDLVDEVIVSLDGDEMLHDEIRNIKGAFSALARGVRKIKELDASFRISARSVIHRLNYRKWTQIVESARAMQLDRISFLPADVTSEAFNREQLWDKTKQESVLVPADELPDLELVLNQILSTFRDDFESGFIAESPEKLNKILQYYRAHHGIDDFPEKKCNAPWVSAVVEADGSVRPCFFHDIIGNVRDEQLYKILNTTQSVVYRKNLDVNKNETCKRCVCYLNLQARNSSY